MTGQGRHLEVYKLAPYLKRGDRQRTIRETAPEVAVDAFLLDDLLDKVERVHLILEDLHRLLLAELRLVALVAWRFGSVANS